MELLIILGLSVFSWYMGRYFAKAVCGIAHELGGNDEDP